ncbi:hypothetical protein HZR07_17040 [Elizabethkingia anophelis]|nr:hypothetical protein [Elizabethkingia anophelis]
MENKLIPMTDFVLSILNNTSPNNFVKGVESIRAYAEFLKQPLALWMFVPCDEGGDPMEYPKDFTHDWELTSYDLAIERVLFEGFKVGYNGLDIISAWNEEITLVFSKKTGICEEYKTIEEFANSNRQPKLTKNPII